MTHDRHEILRLAPEQIQANDLTPVRGALERFTRGQDNITRYAGKLFFDIEDLGSLARDPLLDKRVRAYFQAVDEAYPYLPYFLSRDDESGQFGLYASLIVPFAPEGNHIRFEKQALERFAADKVKAMHGFCQAHQLDARGAIRAFCAQLSLDVLEEVENQAAAYPFEPERITSEFLIDFFKTGYHFHTIDASDEPVLFALVDDPVSAYYAKADVDLQLFESSAYPVLYLDFTVYDVPENPLKMTFFYNIEVEKHRQELAAYAEMSFLTSNILFKKDDELFYGFNRAIELPETLRARIPGLLQKASTLLRAIPSEARDFHQAVEELSHVSAEPPKEAAPVPVPEAAPARILPTLAELIEEEPAPTSPKRKKHAKEKHAAQVELPIAPKHEEESVVASEPAPLSVASPEPEAPEPVAPELNAPEAEGEGDEAAKAPMEFEVSRPEKLPPRAADSSPANFLPENIQRITRALSKPTRRPAKHITEELTIQPAPKRVAMRDEDQLERLSRRLLITQSKLETVERENMRLTNELKGARDEIEKLRRENIDIESRWWKFWK